MLTKILDQKASTRNSIEIRDKLLHTQAVTEQGSRPCSKAASCSLPDRGSEDAAAPPSTLLWLGDAALASANERILLTRPKATMRPRATQTVSCVSARWPTWSTRSAAFSECPSGVLSSIRSVLIACGHKGCAQLGLERVASAVRGAQVVSSCDMAPQPFPRLSPAGCAPPWRSERAPGSRGHVKSLQT